MSKWLYPDMVINNETVRSLASDGEGWQICRTESGNYVLAADSVLIRLWGLYSDKVPGIFSKHDAGGGDTADVWVFCTSEGRLAASLDRGPYPGRRDQIAEFTDAFCEFLDEHPEADLEGAIYIEEHGLLLPVRAEGNPYGNGFAYGKWITRGVNVSIEDTAAVQRLMSWLPETALKRFADRVSVYLKSAGSAGGLKSRHREDRSGEGQGEESGGVQNHTLDEDPVSSISARKDGIPEEDFSLPGNSKLEKFFNEEIVEIVRNADEYKRMGIGFPGAVVLYGPPGTGKTYAVEKLAEYLGWPRYDINSDSVSSPYMHETGMKIARIFDMAISNSPSVVVIDEMEAYLTSRSSSTAHQHHVEEVAEFLRKLPEAAENNVLVFGMTNMLKDIDQAILRRGRFDHMIEVGYADQGDIRILLENKKEQIPIDDNADLDRVARELAGKPMSDVAFVLKEAGRFAVRNRQKTITTAAFLDALGRLPDSGKVRRSIGFSF